ncbi:MAG: hypothetical protein JSV49_05240 [Thermoplasmata archaeon]|nr:MAG: hypothetical protein JSV49_05240 [Thermoplasmata archaeon]
MSEATERVTFRLTPTQTDAIDDIMLRFSYKTRSQVIRAAIENLINDTREEWNSKKIVFHVPKVNVIRLDNLVEDGFANSREDLINRALDDYLSKLEKYYSHEWENYTQKREAFKNAIDQNLSVTKS